MSHTVAVFKPGTSPILQRVPNRKAALPEELTECPETIRLLPLSSDARSPRLTLALLDTPWDPEDTDGVPPRNKDLALSLELLCHENGRALYNTDRHSVGGHEFYGPVVLQATWFDHESGYGYHADVTAAMVETLEARVTFTCAERARLRKQRAGLVT
jgi:hypothetical protein